MLVFFFAVHGLGRDRLADGGGGGLGIGGCGSVVSCGLRAVFEAVSQVSRLLAFEALRRLFAAENSKKKKNWARVKRTLFVNFFFCCTSQPLIEILRCVLLWCVCVCVSTECCVRAKRKKTLLAITVNQISFLEI